MFVVHPDAAANLFILLFFLIVLLGLLAIIGIAVSTLMDDSKNSKPCPTKRKHNHPYQ